MIDNEYVIGIDPGITGGLAMVSTRGRLLDAVEMPNDNHGRVTIPSAARIIGDWCENFTVLAAIIENVGSMPGQGVSTTFKFGRAVGVAETLPTLFALPTHLITPAVWKRHLGLTSDKDSSRQYAIRIWPDKADTLFKLKGVGQARADAALLALAWLQRNPMVVAS